MKKNLLSAALLIAAVIVLLLTCTPFTFGNVAFWFWRKNPGDESLLDYFIMAIPLIVLFLAMLKVCKFVHAAREFRPVRYHKWIFLLLVPCSLALQLALLQGFNGGPYRNEIAAFRDSSNGVFSEKLIGRPANGTDPAEKPITGTCKKAFSKGMFRLCSWISEKTGLKLNPENSTNPTLKREVAIQNMQLVLAVETMQRGYGMESGFVPRIFLVFSALAIACCAFLLWRAARRLFGHHMEAVTTRSAINAVQAAVIFTLPVAMFAGRTEAVDFCISCVVVYFIVCAFRANVGYCKAGFCALAGLCTGAAIAYDIVFTLFIPFMAALLFCRRDWRRGGVPMILFCTGALVFFVAVWAYADVNLFTETIQRFQEARYPESVKFAGLQIPYNLFSLFVFATPMAFLTAFCSRHLSVRKYRTFSIHSNLFAWSTVALVLAIVAVPYVFGATGAAPLAMLPVLIVLALHNVFAARDEMPLPAFQTALLGQAILMAVLYIFFLIPLAN